MAQGKSNHHRLISGTSGPTRISWRPRARRPATTVTEQNNRKLGKIPPIPSNKVPALHWVMS